MSSMNSEKSVIDLLILLQFFFSNGCLTVLKSIETTHGLEIRPLADAISHHASSLSIMSLDAYTPVRY